MAGSLYEPCFAFVTRCGGQDARRAITRITLVAGLAGTVSFPSAHYLTEAFDWRTTVATFGFAILLVAVPLIWIASRYLERNRVKTTEVEETQAGRSTRAILLSPTFILLTVAFAMSGLNHSSLTSHLLPILGWKGIPSELAVLAAACVGPMQVIGRIIMITVERRLSMLIIAHVCFAGQIAASITLLGADKGAFLIIAIFVVLQGACYGVTSIAKPVATAELLGRENFGVISGTMAVPYVFGFAIAPFVSAFLWEIGNYNLVVTATLAYAALALLALVFATRTATSGYRYPPKNS